MISGRLTATAAFSGAFVAVGLIGLAIPIWYVVVGMPVAIVLTIDAARLLRRASYRAPMRGLLPGSAATAS